MTHERFDPVMLAVLAEAVAPITIEQLAARCTDPWAAPLAAEWLREAYFRGLVITRRQSDLPAEWQLTGKGLRAARKG